MEQIPYIAFEAEMYRLERIIKRLWITVLILIILLTGSNAIWIWYESQFEDVKSVESYEAEANDGGNAIINGNGEVNVNGKSEVHGNNNRP